MDLACVQFIESPSKTFLNHRLLGLGLGLLCQHAFNQSLTDSLCLALNKNPQSIYCAYLCCLLWHCCYHIRLLDSLNCCKDTNFFQNEQRKHGKSLEISKKFLYNGSPQHFSLKIGETFCGFKEKCYICNQICNYKSKHYEYLGNFHAVRLVGALDVWHEIDE